MEEIETNIKSIYDTSLTALYKAAIARNVPVRYIVVEPKDEVMAKQLDVITLDDPSSVELITLFEWIQKNVGEIRIEGLHGSLLKLWRDLKGIQGEGETVLPSNLIPVFLHSMPEYAQLDEMEGSKFHAEVNQFMQQATSGRPYTSYAQMLKIYRDEWTPQFVEEFRRDSNELIKIIESQKNLDKIKPLLCSTVNINSIQVSYLYKIVKGSNPLPALFNSATTSYTVPFIQYNLDNVKKRNIETSQRYYKIYRGESLDTKPNYNNVIITGDVNNKPQTMYMNVWMGTESEETAKFKARHATRDSFNIASLAYIPEKSMLRVNLIAPSGGDIIIDRVHNHLGNKLEKPSTEQISNSRISGDFYIYDCFLIEPLFFHVILTSPLFSKFIYLEEQRRILTDKNKLNIHFKGANMSNKKMKSSALANIYSRRISARTKIDVKGKGELDLEDDINAVFVNIKRANSLSVAEQFQNILIRLFSEYNEQLDSLKSLYFSIIPEYADLYERKIKKEEDSLEDTSLAMIAKEVFVPNYSRDVCQKITKPTAFRYEEDALVWAEENPIKLPDGKLVPRRILPFPANPPHLFYFGCKHEKSPYPVVKENRLLPNKNQFPYLPCCAKRDRFLKPTSKTARYYRGSTKEVVIKSSQSYLLSGNKYADRDREGYITPSIVALLRQFDPTSPDQEYYRFGVPKSVNSFIHCILLAVGIRREGNMYFEASNREEYVKEVRKNIPAVIEPELVRQELYDKTNEEILDMIKNESVFFDPLLFYRIMEELFEVNIYIFNLPKAESINKSSVLLLPRHRDFYVKPPNGRPVILIIRHMGIVADGLEYPHCELIIKRRPRSSNLMFFPPEMNKIMYPAFLFVARTLTWELTLEIPGNKILCRQNLYSAINYSMLFGEVPVVGQYIDLSGKARMFALKPIRNSETLLFVGVLPTCPLNCHAFSLKGIYESIPDYTVPVAVFGVPKRVYCEGKEITGLWYTIGDIENCIYCPCKKVSLEFFKEKYKSVEVIEELPNTMVYIPENENLISPLKRLRELNRGAKFIQQIIKYLYLVRIEELANEEKAESEIEDFFETITVLYEDEEKEDSLNVYNMFNLPIALPSGTVSEILKELYEIFNEGNTKGEPRAVAGEPPRLLMYDEKMKSAMLYQLRMFAKEIRGLNIKPEVLAEIQGYFDSKEAFRYDSKYEFILSSRREFMEWCDSHVSSGLEMKDIQKLEESIQFKLSQNTFKYQEPYIYQKMNSTGLGSSYDPSKDKFYLIQNVHDGSLSKCLQLCIVWREQKRNLGYEIKEGFTSREFFPAYIVYSILPGGSTVVEEDHTNGQPNYLEVLKYHVGKYAAMLPIL